MNRAPRLWVFLACLAFGALVEPSLPWTDDMRFYVPAAASYGSWIEAAARLDARAWSRAGVDAAFQVNREHPPVAKLVMAAGWLTLHRWTGLTDDVTACRAGILTLWAWMCALVFGLVRWGGGSALAGVFAAAALALMPRVLFDGHAETLDLAVAAFLTWSTDAFLRALEDARPRRIAVAALVFALALGAKLNAPFFLLGALAFVLVRSRRRAADLVLPPLPWALVAMLLASPLIAAALWPWLWFDTVDRLRDYVQFHLHHYGIFFYFQGVLYGDDVAPWYAPWVMAALTVPLPTLALGLAGALLSLRAPHPLGRFVALQAAVQLTAVSLPGVPVYGGVKLFLPVFPFLAVLAGLAFARVERELTARRGVLGAVAAAALAPSLVGALSYRGAWLSYYNELAGGVRGATAAGYERQYYDLAYPEMARLLGEHLPSGGGVAFLPNPKEYAPYVERWRKQGALPQAVHVAPLHRADVIVLTHERRWREYPELMARTRRHPRLATFAVAGVPMFSLFDATKERP